MSTGIRMLKRGLVVSCQALEGNPLRDSDIISRLAEAAEKGGAVALRINGPEDISAARMRTKIPIIGLYKVNIKGRTVITPDFYKAKEIALVGANIIAIDSTIVQQREIDIKQTFKMIHDELGCEVLADISSLKEAEFAYNAGADYVSTTLSGYMPGALHKEGNKYIPDFEIIQNILNLKLDIPLIAEGRFWCSEDLVKAFSMGVYSIVIGKAITNPTAITEYYIKQIEDYI